MEYMVSLCVDNDCVEPPLDNTSDNVSVETEHVDNDDIESPLDNISDDISVESVIAGDTLEDSLFIPRLNNESSVSEASMRCFKRGEIYENKSVLYEYMKSFGLAWGFSILKENRCICCSRAGRNQIKKNRSYKKIRKCSSIKCGCDWKVCYVNLENGTVELTTCNPNHTNGCLPS